MISHKKSTSNYTNDETLRYHNHVDEYIKLRKTLIKSPQCQKAIIFCIKYFNYNYFYEACNVAITKVWHKRI